LQRHVFEEVIWELKRGGVIGSITFLFKILENE